MKKKSLAERFIFQTGYSLAFGICIASLVASVVTKFLPLLFLVGVGFLIFVWTFFLRFKKEWACTGSGCNTTELFSHYDTYCFLCGNPMGLRKKEKRLCPNRHWVDKWDKFCPKCGGPINRG